MQYDVADESEDHDPPALPSRKSQGMIGVSLANALYGEEEEEDSTADEIQRLQDDNGYDIVSDAPRDGALSATANGQISLAHVELPLPPSQTSSIKSSTGTF